MPSKSVKQQQFMGTELDRARRGKKTRTGLAEATLEDFAATKHDDLPLRAPKPKSKKK